LGKRLCSLDLGFEEEQIRNYIRNQEQLDAQGSDEDGEF
jgi:hypothetical protein